MEINAKCTERAKRLLAFISYYLPLSPFTY